MADSKKYPSFLIEFRIGEAYRKVRVRATDKRRARLRAKQRFGTDIKIIHVKR